MTPQRLAQLVNLLQTLGLDPSEPGGPGPTATALSPIEEALSHSSLRERSNHERMEFLGDAVLRLAATEFLRREQGNLSVGEQSALRGQLVSDNWLAALGEGCGLGEMMRLGAIATGDAAGRATVLAEGTEALLGAIYLAWGGPDGGLEPVIRWLAPHWRATAVAVLADPHRQNWKSALQEWSQGQGLGLPCYACEEKSLAHGDPRRFYCTVSIHDEEGNRTAAGGQGQQRPHRWRGEGWGGSRRQAEQAAARDCLKMIQG